MKLSKYNFLFHYNKADPLKEPILFPDLESTKLLLIPPYLGLNFSGNSPVDSNNLKSNSVSLQTTMDSFCNLLGYKPNLKTFFEQKRHKSFEEILDTIKLTETTEYGLKFIKQHLDLDFIRDNDSLLLENSVLINNFFNKKKENHENILSNIADYGNISSNSFLNRDTILNRSMEKDFLIFKNYFNYSITNLDFLSSKAFKTKILFQVMKQIKFYMLSYYNCIEPVVPYTFQSFAIVSCFMLMSHPFLLVDLGVHSNFYALFQLSHNFPVSYVELDLSKLISTVDIHNISECQYIGKIPYLIDKKVLSSLVDFNFPNYGHAALYTKFLEIHKEFFYQIIRESLLGKQLTCIDISNSMKLILDSIKKN